MASTKAYLDYVLEQLGSMAVSVRPMMGEYLLYCEGKPIGGVYDDRLLLKSTPRVLRLLAEAGLEPETDLPYPGAKPLLVADADRRELLCALVAALAEELPAPKKRGKRGAV